MSALAVLCCMGAVAVLAANPWSTKSRAGRTARSPGAVLARISRAALPRSGHRREAARRRSEAIAATDLLAACLASGASPLRAAEAAAAVLDGQAGRALADAARELRRGAPAEQGWAGLAVLPELAGVARTLARASTSGTRAAAAMDAEAAGLRARSRAAARAALSRVGVWAVAPLALCFLPAFVCLGVAPIALSLAPVLTR